MPRFDLATIVGILAGFGLNVAGIWMGGSPLLLYWNLPSVFITFGGALASLVVQFPIRDLVTFPSVLAHGFIDHRLEPHKMIANLVRYAETARRDGILALEAVTEEIDDEFLITGIQLAVDGTDPELIRSMMDTELEYLSQRHQRGKRMVECMMDMCPAWGMIGTLIGLIAMLKQLSDVSSIGPNMAIALLTTFYGAIGCYLFFKPMSQKLDLRNAEEILMREMIIRGVMSIQSGDNPRIVSQKLRIFLAPNQRTQVT
ncbi:MAG: MotA/TolQ/ExbB proton channel family protein [Planctomycetes bacterium]|nr:MotA/TolQ/ExbB proton channel family protein [Planctomycetota bacterium]